jgi:hypothetical protein
VLVGLAGFARERSSAGGSSRVRRRHDYRDHRTSRPQAGIVLPIPAVEVAVMMLAIGDGICHQRHLPDSVLNSDAFTNATMYLWAGLLTSQSKT